MARARWDFGGATPGSGAAARSGLRGGLHHVEVWVEDIAAAGREWGWLLDRLGYHLGDDWGHGQAWELGSLYVVVESGPDVERGRHERRRAGVNHLAFHGGSREDVDAVVADCAAGGWTVMFADRHPFAGGPKHYAAYLESGEGFEVELVAD